MPRPSLTPRRSIAAQPPRRRKRWLVRGLGILASIMIAATLAVCALTPQDPATVVARAQSAAQAGDWHTALERWRDVNRTTQASASTHLGEAQACLALSLAAQAEKALARANEAAPRDVVPWLMRLSLLHVENRSLEAERLGWSAYSVVSPQARRDVIQALTRVLLTDIPDDAARDRLGRWVAADPEDIDARVALLGRISALPRAGDPDRDSRIATLTTLLAQHPRHVGAREALVNAFADAGEPERGREILRDWPGALRDARYYRLQGRWDLEYDHRPAQAIEAFQNALTELPHEWRTHYRLSRALKIQGRMQEARGEAETVARLREVLNPEALGPQLSMAFSHLDNPRSRLDLARLCASVGLEQLARAWQTDAAADSSLHSGLTKPGLGPPPTFPTLDDPALPIASPRSLR
jgi:tetratricopeptide (TPR) repeat protein